MLGVADSIGNQWFHIQLYRNSEEQYHSGFPEAKFSAKYLKTCAIEYARQQAQSTTLNNYARQQAQSTTLNNYLIRYSFGYSAHKAIHTYIHTYIVNLSELLCLIPILVGSSVATVCPPERDTALRTAVTTVTRVPL